MADPQTVLEGLEGHVPEQRLRQLVVVGPKAMSVIQLPDDGVLTLGRARTAGIFIDDPLVSRQHARVVSRSASAVEIEDLGSANGTRVGDRLLARGDIATMAIGEAVTLGGTTLVVRQAGQPDRAPSHSPLLSSSPPAAEAHNSSGLPSGMLITDARMLEIAQQARNAAAGDLPVLILGETGAGKDLTALLVHEASPRAKNAFVTVDCAALAESLAESELFGYEKGAFTDAAVPKPGLLETAPGGTVFLDEIGELSLKTQAKLLRVLEKNQVIRVGSVKPRPIDVRFVAATNRNLEDDVASGRFRADLFFRLNGFPLTVPPLRDRPDDILPLGRRFLAVAAAKLGRTVPSISPEAQALLARHAWPGNVRDLRYAMERAILRCRGAEILPEHLVLSGLAAGSTGSSDARGAGGADGADGAGNPRGASGGGGGRETTRIDLLPAQAAVAVPAPVGAPTADASAKQRVEEALVNCAGNQSRAAKLLGISRATLIERIKKFGLARPRLR